MASDAALIVVAIVAVAAVGIAVFLLTQPPVPAQTTVVVRERAWRPWGPYYQHLPRHRMLY